MHGTVRSIVRSIVRGIVHRIVHGIVHRTVHGKLFTLHRSQAGERSSVVAQAVNALIASRARVFVSPLASMWTSFIAGLLRRRASDAVSSSPSDVDKRLVEIHRVPSVRNNALRSGKAGGQPATVDAAGWTDF